MESVAIIAGLIEEEVQLLRVHVEYEDLGAEVEAILVFAKTEEATHYLECSEGIDAGGAWAAIPIGVGELPVLCAVSGIGYIAVPMTPGLGLAGVGEVLDVVDSLARA
jgi:hypothetical protein